MDSEVFKTAHFEMRKQYFNELLTCTVGSLTAQAAHAKLLALEDVVAQLNAFITDDKMSKRKT